MRVLPCTKKLWNMQAVPRQGLRHCFKFGIGTLVRRLSKLFILRHWRNYSKESGRQEVIGLFFDVAVDLRNA